MRTVSDCRYPPDCLRSFGAIRGPLDVGRATQRGVASLEAGENRVTFDYAT